MSPNQVVLPDHAEASPTAEAFRQWTVPDALITGPKQVFVSEMVSEETVRTEVFETGF